MKTRLLCVIAAAILLLVSATEFEGVTDVSVTIDIPRAYNVATNSFPRNTIVDITNLENGKKVRVMVLSGLEAAGLLATLSQSAADAIGLRHDLTCRIRMTQPSVDDFSQAQEAPYPQYLLGPLNSAGVVVTGEFESTTTVSIPALLKKENAPVTNGSPARAPASAARRTPLKESAPVTTAKPPAAASAPPANKPAATASAAPANKPATAETAPVIEKAPEKESAPIAAAVTTVAIPPATERVPTAEIAPEKTDPPAKEIAPPAGKMPVVTMIAADDADKMKAASELFSPVTISIVTADDVPEALNDLITIIVPNVTTSAIERENSAVSVAVGKTATGTITKTQPKQQSEPKVVSGSIVLIPAGERLPPIQDQPPAPAKVTPNVASPAPVNTAIATPSPPVNRKDDNRIAESPALNTPPSNEEFSPFQAPLISKLAPGKWYVQLGVYSRSDSVEDEISRIGTAYPVAIQNVGTDTKPIFRVLLGPLSQGESSAMLSRFKSIGYANAFIRHN